MLRARILPLAALCGALLAAAPLNAVPGASSTIADLKGDYDGFYYSTNGQNQGGGASLEVLNKMAPNFTAKLSYIVPTAAGVGTSGAQIDVEGKVTPKGKITMNGTAPGGKLTLAGVLSDQGRLITAAYQIKQGKTVVFKAICYLEEDE